jgi:anti-anti-sigma factor
MTVPLSSGAENGRDAGADPVGPPGFSVEVCPERSVVRVCPVGEVDLSTVGEVRAQIEELKSAGFTRVVLDLREVTFLDSTGLRLMLEEQASSRADGWEFAVIDGSTAVQRLFDVTGLRSMIRFVDPSSLRLAG